MTRIAVQFILLAISILYIHYIKCIGNPHNKPVRKLAKQSNHTNRVYLCCILSKLLLLADAISCESRRARPNSPQMFVNTAGARGGDQLATCIAFTDLITSEYAPNTRP